MSTYTDLIPRQISEGAENRQMISILNMGITLSTGGFKDSKKWMINKKRKK